MKFDFLKLLFVMNHMKFDPFLLFFFLDNILNALCYFA